MSLVPGPPTGPDDRGYEPGGPPVPHPYPAPVGPPPPRPPAPGARAGQAFGVQLRSESQYVSSNASVALTVLEFRLAEPGNPRPLDVLLRGRTLSGTVRDGDWVEVAGAPDATNRWDVTRVENLTTGSTVVVMGGRRSRVATVIAASVLGLVLVGIVIVVIAVLAMAGRPRAPATPVRRGRVSDGSASPAWRTPP